MPARSAVSTVIGLLPMICMGSTATGGTPAFVNWESPHVSPIALTPDGGRLLAVNTADNRLEVFVVTEAGLAPEGSVPVGLDPVSVAARTSTEAWVVNHISDSVSIVDLVTMNVTRTLIVGDEPAGIVFAGAPERAFLSISQENAVLVYDPANLGAVPVRIEIAGEDPRAIATDGTTVWVAIFEAGNDTTIIPEDIVSSSLNPYAGDPNPPPNDGNGFDPPIAAGLPSAPTGSLVVRKDTGGQWRDSNGTDWSSAVGWDLLGHDIAAIDADALTVSYVTGVMTTPMALGARTDGTLLVVGTEALNEVRFEPNLNGTFLRVQAASIAPGALTPAAVADLNPHLDYASPSVAPAIRAQSIGDPRGVAFTPDGARVFVTGMGSNAVVMLQDGLRSAPIAVGEGPTGICVEAVRPRAFVLDKFEGAISIIDTDALVETQRVPFFDPTPAVIRDGRPLLYDTVRTSGLGHVSCGSCHVDGRMDQLAWDLGDPSGEMKEFNQVCNFGLGGCEDWHPMKGPMVTQTLVGIIGTEPFHWRADREDLAAFNPAFVSLLGADAELTASEMAAFEAFVGTLSYPPNPNRHLDNSLPVSMPNGGDALEGENLFLTADLDGVDCVTCHANPTGTNGTLTSAPLLQESQSMKIPQLRNMHERTGFDLTSNTNHRGFGFTHDGAVDTLFQFLQFPGFQFSGGAAGDQERRDIVAFMNCFSTDTHAGVGAQVTLDGSPSADVARRTALLDIAASGAVDAVVKGRIDGLAQGFVFLSADLFQSDRLAEQWTLAELDAATALGSELTYTLVPVGSGERIGIDRDEDGAFDRDELDACSNPADPMSLPGNAVCVGDLTGPDGTPDGEVGFQDLVSLLSQWGASNTPADLDCSGSVDFQDFVALLAAWGSC